MQRRNLFAQLYFLDSRAEYDVRQMLKGALGVHFDEQFARRDESGTTWFGDSFGFEILFGLVATVASGNWYMVSMTAGGEVFDPDAPMEEIDFHVSRLLRQGGVDAVANAAEYLDISRNS